MSEFLCLRPLAFVAGMMLTLPVAAQQPAWPSKPIRIVAPAAAGSGTDLMARLVGQPMQAALGQPVLVENRVGGGGSVGMAAVASAAPDGYTLLLSTDATIAIQPHFRKEAFDPSKDLSPIGEIASFALVVVVRSDSPIASLKDLAQAARARPGGIAYGVGGKATGGHITGETIRLSLDIPLTAVAYPSAARAVTDLLGGHVDVAISDSVSIVPHVKSGKLKAIATAAAVRAAACPTPPRCRNRACPSTCRIPMACWHRPERPRDRRSSQQGTACRAGPARGARADRRRLSGAGGGVQHPSRLLRTGALPLDALGQADPRRRRAGG